MHCDLDDIGVRLERHLDLAQIVVGVGVFEGEVDEAGDDRLQPLGIFGADSARRRKRRDEGQHQRSRAVVTKDAGLHSCHRKRRSYALLG